MIDFLSNLSISASWLHWLPASIGISGLPDAGLALSALFSGAGALILGKFTGHVGFITMPLNYCVLLVGAVVSNWALREVRLPIDPNLQTPMVFTLAGMTAAALMMMMTMRSEAR